LEGSFERKSLWFSIVYGKTKKFIKAHIESI
jgi:hypothetical protein